MSRFQATFDHPPPSSAKSLFCAMTYTVIALLLYAYASYQLEEECFPLASRCAELEQKLVSERARSKELSEMVSNLADPAADEYALITELGKVPEGGRKIFFHHQENQL